MFKYLAGIFAKPHNDYVDGRLTTPLSSICHSKKVAAGRHPHQCSQMKLSLKAILSSSETAPIDEKYSRSPKRRRKITRQTQRKPKAQVLDPVSYIANVEASSSSHDDKESILLQAMPRRLRGVRPNDCDSNVNSLEDRSSFLQTEIPVPPPVSRVQSLESLNGDSANEAIIATILDQLPYAGDQELGCDSISQESTSTSNPNDWEMGWLPEEFWSSDTDAVKTSK